MNPDFLLARDLGLLAGKVFSCHRHNYNPRQIELSNNRLGDTGFPRTRAASYGNNADIRPWWGIVGSLLNSDMALELGHCYSPNGLMDG
jgi:hypothetical protein